MTSRLPIFALALLGACGEPSDQASVGNQSVDASAAPEAVQARRAPDGAKMEQSADASTLNFTSADGEARLHATCGGKPALLSVHVPSFTAIDSEDRLAFGIGSEPVTLVADPTRQRAGEGVRAEGPVPDGFLAMVTGATQVSANYGAQNIGPFEWPSRAAADAFARACLSG